MHPKPYLHLLLGLLLSLVSTLSAQVPGLINYQGRVAVGGINFDGSGQFKFALVNSDGTFTHWSNDGTFSGEPAAAVAIPVVKGLYSVLLGDTNLPNMQSIPPFAFRNEDVRLRVWFNDGTHGFQQLTPDQRIAAAGYAMMAANVPDGAINQLKLAPGAVTGSAIAPFSIDANHLQNGAVTADKIAAGSVTRDAIVDGAVNAAKISDGAVNTRQIAAAAIGGESWIPTPNPPDGPVGRYGHSVVWTGTEFIIWGGVADVFGGPAVSNTGARFNPATGVWTNITLTGAPAARRGHTAVWTGSEMIVWGGTSALDGESGALQSGGRYNPVTDSWTNTGGGFGVPPGRRNHTAVWTGSDMIIWGGLDGGSNLLGDGSKLNGATNIWSAVAVDDAPEVRHSHSAIWTGSKMVIWGGIGPSGPENTGNVYDTALDIWSSTSMPLTGAPEGRSGHSVVWTGTEMIVWGGDGASAHPVTGGTSTQFQNGGRYRVATNSWHPLSTTGVPAHRTGHTAVWTGNEMLVWGGNTSTDLGGGTNVAGSLDDGAVYVPGTDTWRPMIQTGAPSARTEYSAAWTGREMIVWGGNGQGNLLNTGGRYRLSVIADGAVGVRQLADGAVGSQQLSIGAVGTSQLADGAVQSSKLANGAVGSSQLGDYSVRVNHLSLGTRTGDLTDGTLSSPDAGGIIDFTVNFEPPFSSVPTVTMTSNRWQIGVTTSGNFTASAPGQFTDIVAGTLPNFVLGRSASVIVEGRPAIALGVNDFGGGLWYQRASNAEGTTWDSPVQIATGDASVISMKIIGGRPAVLFASASACKFVRATNATGTAWAAPVTVPGISASNSPVLAEIAGKPAVASVDSPPFVGVQNISYITTSDVEGTTWSTLQTAVPAPASASTVFSSVRLIEAAGRPAISFVQAQYDVGGTQELFYVRANNGVGSAWPTPSLVFELGALSVPGYAATTQERYVEMATIDGNPALASVAVEGGMTDKVIYLRSTTPEGSAWQTASFTAGEPYTQMSIRQLGVIAGLPMITYSVTGESAPRYIRLASATDFGPISPYTRFVRCNGFEDLLELSGKPASVFAAGEDLVVRTLDSSAPPSRWTASDGTIAPLIAATVQPGAIGSTHLADGAVGSAQLAAGAVTTTQLASGAVQGTNIASGAVGSTQLAAGAVTNAQLAAGSVQAANIAPGAIDFSALAKPPQAGTLAVQAAEFTFGQAGFEATFPLPFAIPPIVTMAQSAGGIDPGSAGSLVLESATTGGFSGRIFRPLSVASTIRSYGSAASLQGGAFAMIGGRPALCYATEDGFLRGITFVRASNSEGTEWEAPVVVVSENLFGFGDVSLAEVDGKPAIAFVYDETLRYVRATTVSGSNWETPVLVSTIDPVRDAISLSEISGNPAIAFARENTATEDRLSYARAATPEGTGWSVRNVSSASNHYNEGSQISLCEAGGLPLIATRGSALLVWVGEAADGTGFWSGELPFFVSHYSAQSGAAVGIVDGVPAVVGMVDDGTNKKLLFAKAANSSGTDWSNATVELMSWPSSESFSNQISMRVVNNRAVVAVYRPTGSKLMVVSSKDQAATSWTRPAVVAEKGNVGHDATVLSSSVAFVDQPAVGYLDATQRTFRFLIDEQDDSTSSTTVNWIALPQ